MTRAQFTLLIRPAQLQNMGNKHGKEINNLANLSIVVHDTHTRVRLYKNESLVLSYHWTTTTMPIIVGLHSINNQLLMKY